MHTADQILSMEVPCDHGAARTVRRAITRMDWREGVNSDVLIVASELVNNAVVHSGCVREDLLDVRATLSVDRLMFSVRNPGASDHDAVARVDGDSRTGAAGACDWSISLPRDGAHTAMTDIASGPRWQWWALLSLTTEDT